MSDDLRMTIRDELLILRCQQGETDAFATLVDRWQQPLLRYAMRVTGDHDAAFDAVQETWMAAIAGLVRLKEIACFKVWLFRVLSNKCRDRLRSAARRDKLLAGAAAQHRAKIQPPAGEQAGLWEVVEKLPRESQAVLTLMYVEGFSVSEMAQVLGVPQGTVKSRLHYAREAVRKATERS